MEVAILSIASGDVCITSVVALEVQAQDVPSATLGDTFILCSYSYNNQKSSYIECPNAIYIVNNYLAKLVCCYSDLNERLFKTR